MNFKQIILFSLVVPGSGIAAVDLGNFEYISAKYRPYFPEKQISNQSQQSSFQKAKGFVQTHWPMMAQAACIVGGAAAGHAIPKHQTALRATGVLSGIGIGLFGSAMLEESNRKQYLLEYKRYSTKYPEVAKARKSYAVQSGKPATDYQGWYKKQSFVHDCNSVVEEYNVLSRYPKREMEEPSAEIAYGISNRIGVGVLTLGSLAWIAPQIFRKIKEDHEREMAHSQQNMEALQAAQATGNPLVITNAVANVTNSGH